MSRLRALLPQLNDLTAMRRQPGRDLLAGCTVGIISSGLGAGAGLVTAVVAGILAAGFGGSNLASAAPLAR